MAGRARRNALIALLEHLTRATFEDEPDKTHLDYVCERIECGTTTKQLCAELTPTLGHELTYARLIAYLAQTFGEGATDERIDSARARASHLFAEEGLEIVDAAPTDSSAGVSKAMARAKQRQWMAERYNPARFGSQKGVSVSISVGHLHLAALQAVPNRVTTGVARLLDNPEIIGQEQAQSVILHDVSSD